MKIWGSCVCGAVGFVINGRPGGMGQCNCARCRKLGTSTMVFVLRAQFRLTQAEEEIATLDPQTPFTYQRSFCRRCGTGLGEPLSPDEVFPINAQ